jgi:hypothetical protein
MSLMKGVFRECLENFVQVFIDDFLIYSRMMEEHEKLLRLVLQCLRENKLQETVEMLFLSIKDSLFRACYL